MKKYQCRYFEIAEIKFHVEANSAEDAERTGQDMVDDGRVDLMDLYPLGSTVYAEEPGKSEAQSDYDARRALVEKFGSKFRKFADNSCVLHNGKAFILIERFKKIIDVVEPAAMISVNEKFLDRVLFPETGIVSDYFAVRRDDATDSLIGTWFVRQRASLEELEAVLRTEAEEC